MLLKLSLFKSLLKYFYNFFKSIYFKIHQYYFHKTGYKVQCNICNYKANKLNSDMWHFFCRCPICSSGVRHRLLMASFLYSDNFSFEKIINNKIILHFAPELYLSKILQNHAKLYNTADFLTEGYRYKNIDFNIDISNMKHINDYSYDCIIALDVLEHVLNYKNALYEVHRVLKIDGYCIFTIPQKDNLIETYEDLSIVNKIDRINAFGQSDHLRIFGDDFLITLQGAGFEVTAIDENHFNKDIIFKNVLFPPILSKNPLATNFRKVYFGKKIV
jgi:SAM-dependent methyltransferase